MQETKSGASRLPDQRSRQLHDLTAATQAAQQRLADAIANAEADWKRMAAAAQADRQRLDDVIANAEVDRKRNAAYAEQVRVVCSTLVAFHADAVEDMKAVEEYEVLNRVLRAYSDRILGTGTTKLSVDDISRLKKDNRAYITKLLDYAHPGPEYTTTHGIRDRAFVGLSPDELALCKALHEKLKAIAPTRRASLQRPPDAASARRCLDRLVPQFQTTYTQLFDWSVNPLGPLRMQTSDPNQTPLTDEERRLFLPDQWPEDTAIAKRKAVRDALQQQLDV